VRSIDIRNARKNLSRLVDDVAGGDPFIIVRSGRPLVKVVALGQARERPVRLGFMAGQSSVPDDFDRMGECEIAELFSGKD